MRSTPTSTIALALALAAWSCYEDDTTGLVRGKPTTTVELTDDPFPYDSVARADIYVVKIEASTSLDTSDLNPDWVTIAEPHAAFNLIALTGGLTDTLGRADVAPGLYRSIRMILDTDSSSITSKQGQPIPVDWQSSSGRPVLYAYVENPIQVTDFGAEIVIDFDAGRSFLCDSPCSSFVFSPVFRAVNKASTGSISGRVTGDTLALFSEAIKDVSITVYRGDFTAFPGTWFVVATGKTDSLGDFRIAYLTPGTYILRADAPRASPFTPGVRANVVVNAGQETQNQGIILPRGSVGAIILAPTPGPLGVGDSVVLTATVLGFTGTPIPNPVVSWTLTDTTVAQIYLEPPGQSETALLKAKAVGSTQLIVRSSGLVTSYLVEVTAGPPPPPVPVASVTVSPSTMSIARGDTLVLVATARDSAGGTLTNRLFTWTTSDSLVASVTILGAGGQYVVIRGGVPGTAVVRASTEGKTGSATVTVGQ